MKHYQVNVPAVVVLTLEAEDETQGLVTAQNMADSLSSMNIEYEANSNHVCKVSCKLVSKYGVISEDLTFEERNEL